MKIKKYSFLAKNILMTILYAHIEDIFSQERMSLRTYFKAIANIVKYFVDGYERQYVYEGFLFTDKRGRNVWLVQNSFLKSFFFAREI